jgi:cytosine permease
MSNPENPITTPMSSSGSSLPSYIAGAIPNPPDKRAPWYKNTAPTYAGIFLWFVFWQDAVNAPNAGGLLSQGVAWALISLVLAALICHFLFYLVPGLLGMKTGLPLYIVGTSTFGATGGFLMPGFLMGVLQFGWLAVNIYFSSALIGMFFFPEAKIDPMNVATIPGAVKGIMVLWGVLAAFVGLKGIQYVAKVATYLPLIPLAILAILLAKTVGTIGGFDAAKFVDLHKTAVADTLPALDSFGVLAAMLTFVVGFFATAGAAGVDFGTNSRNKKDVSMGGIVGVALAIILTAGASILIVAGTYGSPALSQTAVTAGSGKMILQSPGLIPVIMGASVAKWMMFLLAIAAFPPACFSSFIAANSFKTTLTNVNPFVSVGIGAAVSIALAISGWAGKAIIVFEIIGASFGPICGAMLVDYLLSGSKWNGPRAGFNPAGWIAWLLGFGVGIMPILHDKVSAAIPAVPAAPVAAFVVGAVIYFICAKAKMLSATVPMPVKQ